jgi:alkylation response protein AidB-like acyl-CoA dehydrogenase
MNFAVDRDPCLSRQDQDPVERARRLQPLITGNAERIDREQALPREVVEALHEAGLFRLLLPRSANGEEIEPARFVQVIMALAAADASVAWCVGQASGCSMASAYMDPDAVAVIWGCDPRAVLAWGAGTTAVAKAVEGGYRVSGAWGFASGNRHATWLGGHCGVEERDGAIRRWPNGTPVERTMLFPRSRAEIKTGWDVLGLRGTGSDGYSVQDLFVPEAHSVCRDRAEYRREPGPLYKFSTTNLYGSSFGAVALGIARGALDALVGVATVKTPATMTRAMRDSAVVQGQVALAEAKLQSARLLLIDTLRDAWGSVAGGGGHAARHEDAHPHGRHLCDPPGERGGRHRLSRGRRDGHFRQQSVRAPVSRHPYRLATSPGPLRAFRDGRGPHARTVPEPTPYLTAETAV